MSATTFTKRQRRGEQDWNQSILEDDVDQRRQLDRTLKFSAQFERLVLFTAFKIKAIFNQFNAF